VVISTEEKMRALALEETERENVPSGFVMVPVVVPFTTTEALATGLPFSSVTFPVTVRCAIACMAKNTMPAKSRYSFLMRVSFMVSNKILSYPAGTERKNKSIREIMTLTSSLNSRQVARRLDIER
jgi:hypothetical protein